LHGALDRVPAAGARHRAEAGPDGRRGGEAAFVPRPADGDVRRAAPDARGRRPGPGAGLSDDVLLVVRDARRRRALPAGAPVCSALCGGGALVVRDEATARSLRGAGYWTILLAAGGSLFAVASGLAMARGAMLGAGDLGAHHLFVWPAFTLLAGLATWRLLVRELPAGRARLVYPLLAALAAALMLGAGYFGGEM